MKVTIITGISGAGKSSALKTLEDIDFLCADNIPPALIPQFVQPQSAQKYCFSCRYAYGSNV